MGAYATFWIGGFDIAASRNDVDAGIMSLFRAQDRRVRSLGDHDIPNFITDQYADEGDDLRFFYYTTSVYTIRDRLELAGYTVENCRHLFQEWKTLEIRQRESRSANCDIATQDKPSKLKTDTATTPKLRDVETQQLRELTVDSWLRHLRYIIENDLRPEHAEWHQDSYLGKMLKWSSKGWYGYDGPDPLVAIRLAIEVFPSAAYATYDLTDLVAQNYITENDDPIERLINWSADDYHSQGRTIILTEGRSDVVILKSSLDLLFPHLADYFSFMDYTEFGGGAGQLANLIRAFAGAGVVNRVVAIFDNDAAAIAAMRTLPKELPRHIIVMRLPDLPILSSYPTVGPSGPSLMNVNGMAASIELYLGADVLRDARGQLPPIQWTGYERSIRTYQGELSCKQEVQERFRKKVSQAHEDPIFFEAADWSGLHSIFQELFKSFHELDGDMLFKQLRYVYGQD